MRSRESSGSFAGQVNLTAFAILALRAAGHSAAFAPIRLAACWIEHQQGREGGFSFGARGSSSDVDDTGAVLRRSSRPAPHRPSVAAPPATSPAPRIATAASPSSPAVNPTRSQAPGVSRG